MKLCSLASGSSGNSIFLETDKSKFLIDAGLSGKTIELLMKSIGQDPRDLDAIFVSHEHSDHVKGVGVMSRRYDLPIIASEGTWLGMRNKIGKIKPKNIIVFKAGSFFSYRDIDVQALKTYHDAKDPVSFIFYQRKQKITVLTDTGRVDEKMEDAIRGSNIYYIESNHDLDMLRYGPYPYHLKMRILSDKGHLSNDMTRQVLERLLEGRGEIVMLSHLSKTNNTEIIAFDNVNDHLIGLGLDTKKDIKLRVSPRSKAGILSDLGGNYEH